MRFDVRWVLLVVLSITILLAQSAPGIADHNSNLSVNAGEICADDGRHLLRAGDHDQAQLHECDNCDYCLNATGGAQAIHPLLNNAFVLIDTFNISYPDSHTILPDNPEQYWSACRGPPIASLENNMISNTSLAIKELAGTVTTARGVPCA